MQHNSWTGIWTQKMLWAQQAWNNKLNLTLSNSAFRNFIGRDLQKGTRSHNSANSFYHCSTFCPRSKLFTSAMTQLAKIKGWILAPLLFLVSIVEHPVGCYRHIIQGGTALCEERSRCLCSESNKNILQSPFASQLSDWCQWELWGSSPSTEQPQPDSRGWGATADPRISQPSTWGGASPGTAPASLCHQGQFLHRYTQNLAFHRDVPMFHTSAVTFASAFRGASALMASAVQLCPVLTAVLGLFPEFYWQAQPL